MSFSWTRGESLENMDDTFKFDKKMDLTSKNGSNALLIIYLGSRNIGMGTDVQGLP